MATDERVGIPRGIGFSAYLSELFLRGFDSRIKSSSNVTYYTRYVDDIIIIVTPKHRNEIKSVLAYKEEIKKVLWDTTKLSINTSKTEVIDLTKENKERKRSITYTLTYLGYKFKISYSRKTEKKCDTTKTSISKNKLQYLER